VDRTARSPHPLCAWRRLRRLSQTALSDRAAVSLSTIARLESRSTAHPRPHVARRIAAALATNPDCVSELAGAIPRLRAGGDPTGGDETCATP
jgi:transcriptional regulator with XRE-family HTH domain